MGNVLNFISKNWVNLLLVFVGSFALFIYWLQERKKKIEAASLIVLQIEELQDRLREISTYIINGDVNSRAFYESLPLMNINYWIQYKHYFVRKMDQHSFSTIDLFYSYASEIHEQQTLLKEIQKRFLYHTQDLLSKIESNLIESGLNDLYDLDPQKRISLSQFWDTYRVKRENLKSIVNQGAMTEYSPLQISMSIEKILKEYSMLEVTGNRGYQLLCKVSKKRF